MNISDLEREYNAPSPPPKPDDRLPAIYRDDLYEESPNPHGWGMPLGMMKQLNPAPEEVVKKNDQGVPEGSTMVYVCTEGKPQKRWMGPDGRLGAVEV